MLEFTPRTTAGSAQGRYQTQSQQPRRLMLALVLLLVALVVLLVKDRQFWFGSEETTVESDMPESTVPTQTTATPVVHPAHPKAAAKKQTQTTVAVNETQPAQTPGVAMTRTILPPLDVEVVAGDKHRKVHPGTNVKHVEIPTTPSALAPATNAAEREPVASAAAQPPASASYTTNYPLLAQHMNVQGSVVLQALISAEGIVENLRVVSGPAILSTAAQQAVREWRFKPVLQNGQAVETKAKITVNFSIKVADNSADTTLAESRADDIVILSR